METALHDPSALLQNKPPNVVSALASRLVELQICSAGDETDPVPMGASSKAGKREYLALAIIEFLKNRLMEGEDIRHPLVNIFNNLKESNPELEFDEMVFVARFLSKARDYHFVPDDEFGVERTTRAWTKLIDYDGTRGHRVKLTEAGRCFLRISDNAEHWLWQDKEVEKLTISIERGRFDAIPSLCVEIRATISAMIIELVKGQEQGSMELLRDSWLQQRESVVSMISQCEVAIHEALNLIERQDTMVMFDQYYSHALDENRFSLAELKASLLKVNEAVDRLAQRFAATIASVMNDTEAPMGVIDFGAVAQGLLEIQPSRQLRLRVSNFILGYSNPFHFLSLADVAGSFPDEDEIIPQKVTSFDLSDLPKRHFESWLAANKEKLTTLLNAGQPVSFSELIRDGHFVVEDHHQASQLFGAFIADIEADDGSVFRVRSSDKTVRTSITDRVMTHTDMTLQLVKEEPHGA